MAQLTILQNDDNVYWPDAIEGGTEVSRSQTEYRYESDAGFTIAFFGTGFGYDAEGMGSRGNVTRVAVFDSSGTKVLEITGVVAGLQTLMLLALGYPREGQSPQNPDGDNFFGHLLRGNDTVIGSDDDDDIIFNGSGGYGDDLVRAGLGHDFVKADAGNDTLFGGTGDYSDELAFIAAYNDPLAFQGAVVNAATGVVTDCWGFTDQIADFERYRDSPFADKFIGSGIDEVFRLTRGADTVNGGGGWDQIRYDRAGRYGAQDGIRVDLAAGTIIDSFGLTDRVSNVEGVFGTNWDDVFNGNGGDNSFQGAKGTDRFDGKAGFDRVEFWAVGDLGGHGVVIDMSVSTANILDDGFGNEEVVVGIEAFSLSSLNDSYTGGAGRDDVWADEGNDTLRGGGGEDFLNGAEGNDELYGGTGENHLSGGEGNDSLYGGSNDDDFNFRELGTSNRDTIFGFSRAQGDEIWIDSDWGGLSSEFLTAAQFRSGAGVTTASTSAHRVIYNTSNGALYFDRDGAGGAAAEIFAVVDNRAALNFGDFHVFL